MPTKNVAIGARKVALDARPDRLDLRDRIYLPPLQNLPPQYPSDKQVQQWLPAYAKADLVLNQGQDGACTGFGLAAVINYQRFASELLQGIKPTMRRASPAMLYELARLYDEWPGEDYEGSSCRGALKGWHRHGVCRDTLWPFVIDKNGKRQFKPPKEDPKLPDDPDRNWDVDALACTLGVYYRVDTRSVVDMQAAIYNNGALYVSATVHEGWDVPGGKPLRGHADLARITSVAEPKDAGGHAFALVGYNEFGFVVQNSWGPDWGSHGFALLPYEDWVLHGNDAWVLTLGVPRQRAVLAGAPVAGKGKRKSAPAEAAQRTLRTPRFYLPSGSGAAAAAMERPAGMIGADDALTRRARGAADSAPAPLDTEGAYRHTVILDRGFPVRNDITAEDAAAALQAAVLKRPLDWLKAQGADKLMIYVHGGLNSEEASITRIRAMAPYALVHGIYPLFISWRSGPMETVGDLVEEARAKSGLGAPGAAPARGFLDRITDTTDRMLEPVLRGPGGAMWSQMKINAVRASDHEQGGVRQMVAQLAALKAKRPGLEIHLVGHSAGSIVLGPMLGLLGQAGLKAASTRLFAPACTARFAVQHYVPAVQGGVLAAQHLHVHLLSDKNEQDDAVGPYCKSLLYLVSRAFEDSHKTPLLGMAHCFDPAKVSDKAADDVWAQSCIADARQWQSFWRSAGGPGDANLHVLAERSVSTGVRSIQATHGCFDNDVQTMGQALGYILDASGSTTVPVARLDY